MHGTLYMHEDDVYILYIVMIERRYFVENTTAGGSFFATRAIPVSYYLKRVPTVAAV